MFSQASLSSSTIKTEKASFGTACSRRSAARDFTDNFRILKIVLPAIENRLSVTTVPAAKKNTGLKFQTREQAQTCFGKLKSC